MLKCHSGSLKSLLFFFSQFSFLGMYSSMIYVSVFSNFLFERGGEIGLGASPGCSVVLEYSLSHGGWRNSVANLFVEA